MGLGLEFRVGFRVSFRVRVRVRVSFRVRPRAGVWVGGVITTEMLQPMPSTNSFASLPPPCEVRFMKAIT